MKLGFQSAWWIFKHCNEGIEKYSFWKSFLHEDVTICWHVWAGSELKLAMRGILASQVFLSVMYPTNCKVQKRLQNSWKGLVVLELKVHYAKQKLRILSELILAVAYKTSSGKKKPVSALSLWMLLKSSIGSQLLRIYMQYTQGVKWLGKKQEMIFPILGAFFWGPCLWHQTVMWPWFAELWGWWDAEIY